MITWNSKHVKEGIYETRVDGGSPRSVGRNSFVSFPSFPFPLLSFPFVRRWSRNSRSSQQANQQFDPPPLPAAASHSFMHARPGQARKERCDCCNQLWVSLIRGGGIAIVGSEAHDENAALAARTHAAMDQAAQVALSAAPAPAASVLARLPLLASHSSCILFLDFLVRLEPQFALVDCGIGKSGNQVRGHSP